MKEKLINGLEALYGWLEASRRSDVEWVENMEQIVDDFEEDTTGRDEPAANNEKAWGYLTSVCVLTGLGLCSGLFMILLVLLFIPITVWFIVRRYVQRGVKRAMQKLQGDCN